MDRTSKSSVYQKLPGHSQAPNIPDGYIVIERPDSSYKAWFHEIVCLEADDNCTTIYLCNSKRYFMCRTLKSYEEELPQTVFYRCDKSWLVNVTFIREVVRKSSEICLTNNDRIHVSRRKLPKLLTMIKNQKYTDN